MVKYLVFLILVLVNQSIQKKDRFLLQIDTCKYEFDDGNVIDLTSLDNAAEPRFK